MARKASGWPVVKRSKYRATPTWVHGFRFASKAEARRYHELLLMGMAGEIRNLELQPRFPIMVAGEKVAEYVADFRYEREIERCREGEDGGIMASWEEWIDVVEDVKGMKTPVYRLKKKLVEAQHGIVIREIR